MREGRIINIWYCKRCGFEIRKPDNEVLVDAQCPKCKEKYGRRSPFLSVKREEK